MYVLMYAGSSNEVNILSVTCSTSNAITAVVSCAVSFIITTVIGDVVHYSVVRKKSKFQKLHSLIASHKQHKQQPVPVYKDVVGQSHRIEMKENVADGPVQPGAWILCVNIFHSCHSVVVKLDPFVSPCLTWTLGTAYANGMT